MTKRQYKKLIKYLKENVKVDERKEDIMLECYDKYRCPLQDCTCGSEIFGEIETAIEDWCCENDIDIDTIYDDTDIEDIYWDVRVEK